MDNTCPDQPAHSHRLSGPLLAESMDMWIWQNVSTEGR